MEASEGIAPVDSAGSTVGIRGAEPETGEEAGWGPGSAITGGPALDSTRIGADTTTGTGRRVSRAGGRTGSRAGGGAGMGRSAIRDGGAIGASGAGGACGVSGFGDSIIATSSTRSSRGGGASDDIVRAASTSALSSSDPAAAISLGSFIAADSRPACACYRHVMIHSICRPSRRAALRKLGGVLAGAGARSSLPAALISVAGCGTSPRGDRALTRRAGDGDVSSVEMPGELLLADIVLLGEVHDNRRLHAMRLGWLRRLADGRAIGMAMEQFDVDRQSDIDRARARGADAEALARAAGFRFDAWDWPSYRPLIDWALASGTPLYAANLNAVELMRLARSEAGHAMLDGQPPGWSADDERVMRTLIRDGHCGMLPERAVPAMTDAQRLRDLHMARAVERARRLDGRPVVLLAGNVHVRNDIGVPRWLSVLRPGDRVAAVGFVETDGVDARPATRPEPADPPGAFDWVLSTEPAQREDPCARLRRRAAPLFRTGGVG